MGLMSGLGRGDPVAKIDAEIVKQAQALATAEAEVVAAQATHDAQFASGEPDGVIDATLREVTLAIRRVQRAKLKAAALASQRADLVSAARIVLRKRLEAEAIEAGLADAKVARERAVTASRYIAAIGALQAAGFENVAGGFPPVVLMAVDLGNSHGASGNVSSVHDGVERFAYAIGALRDRRAA